MKDTCVVVQESAKSQWQIFFSLPLIESKIVMQKNQSINKIVMQTKNRSFLNGHTLGFQRQKLKLEQPCTALLTVPSKRTA